MLETQEDNNIKKKIKNYNKISQTKTAKAERLRFCAQARSAETNPKTNAVKKVQF